MRFFDGVRLWLPFYAVLVIASGFVDLRTRAHPEHAVKEYIPQVVAGSADPPGNYRVLAPFSHDALVRATGVDGMTVWHLGRLAWFAVAFVALHAYLRTWFPVATAMFGVTIVAALLPMTYTNSWAHPDHIPELALFTIGCLAIARSDDLWFAITLVLATLNRETAAFLVPAYLLAAPLTTRRTLRTALWAAIWMGLYVGLRWWRGYAPYDMWQLWRNIEFLKLLPPPYDPYYRAYAWFGLLTFGPLAWLAWQARTRAPLMPRRMLWVLPLIAFVGATISSIIETRIFTPAFPLVLPGLLFALVQPASVSAEEALPLPRPPAHG